MEGRLGLTWGLSSIHGWGVFGLNLVRVLMSGAQSGWPRPLLLNETPLELIAPPLRPMLEPLVAERERLAAASAHLGQVGLADTLVLHSSGNGLAHNEVSARFRGTRNAGFTFFEETLFTADAIRAARTLDTMRTGSAWNRDVLKEAGLDDVVCVHQGVDTETFRPRPKAGTFDGRFVVFSGGKLEFRKGQDLVLAAFKAFHARHPEALLVSVWQNPWPESVATIAESPHVSTLPDPALPPERAFPAWTAAEGLPPGAHIDLGAVANADMPGVLAEADAAVFPNRAEGGTNLVAMECLASAVPCVISMNTGHLDIADPGTCHALAHQRPVTDHDGRRQGWGESAVDEIVSGLEAILDDRDDARARAGRARTRMQSMTWERQIAALVDSFG